MGPPLPILIDLATFDDPHLCRIVDSTDHPKTVHAGQQVVAHSRDDRHLLVRSDTRSEARDLHTDAYVRAVSHHDTLRRRHSYASRRRHV